MFGPAPTGRGGMASVIQSYEKSGLFEDGSVEFVETHVEGTKARKGVALVRALSRLGRYLISRRVTLVHIHVASRVSFWRKMTIALPVLGSGAALVLHLHGAEFRLFYDRATALARYVIRFAFQRADRVIVLSEGWREWVSESFPEARVQVIYNPVEMPSYTDYQERKKNTILFLGRIGERKGVRDLIKAASLLAPKMPSLRVMLAGDGDLVSAKQWIAEAGLENNVDLLGWIGPTERAELLRTAWVYVLPSYNEGLPISILEAMAAGMPVISTSVGGIPEALREDIEGYLVTPGDVDALAERLCRVLQDESLQRRLGGNARSRAASEFAIDKILREITAMHTEVLKERQARRVS